MVARIAAALLAFVVSSSCYAQLIPERVRLFMAARYSDLEQLVEREIKDTANPPSSKLLYLCTAYGKLKRYTKLFNCLDQLDANVKRGDIAANESAFEAMKGDVRPWLPLLRAEAYTELRDYDKAIAAAHQALAAVPQRWNEERGVRIQALTALGLSHAFAEKKEQAAKYAEMLAAVSTAYPFTALTDAKVLGVAKIYLAIGDYKKAYQGVRSDSAGFGQIFVALGDAIGGGLSGMAGESFFTYQTLPKQFMVVKTQLEVGEVKQAKAGYDALLAIPRVRDNGEIYWVLLYDRGRIAAEEGDFSTAIDLWKKAIEVIEQQRSSINTEANKIGFIGDRQAVYKRLIDALFSTGQLPEAFDYLERSKSRALVDMLAKQKDFAAPGVDESKIRELLAQIARVEADAVAQSGSDQQAGEVMQRTRANATVRRSITEAAPELASLVSVSATPIPEIQSRLSEDEALVEYYYDEKSLYAFVLTRQGLQAVRLESKGLEEEIRTLRREVESARSEAYLAPAQSLYKRLIQPVEALAGKDKLVIVAHGALHYLPFGALHDGTRFLIDRYSLRFLPSASVLSHIRTTKLTRPAGILAFGNPDLGNAKYDLPFAQEEALAVVRTVADSKAFVRRDATVSALTQFAGAFQYLHFATHGEFDSQAPLDSALLLAKEGASDGLLTVGKLYTMRLDVDMVTLSACETALGKIASGDDVIGLTRGFLYAGATTIVASLWKVDDEATAQLMTRFYEDLKNKDKREALRQAQRAAFQKYPHPYYWAAFQLTGNAN